MPESFLMKPLADIGLLTVQRFKLLEEVKQLQPVTDKVQEWPTNLFRAQFDRFELWAVNLGLFVMGHGSLDYRIRDSESMRDSIDMMMENLNRSLDEVLDYANGNADHGDENSDTDSEKESDTDLLLKSIKDPIDRLYKLAVWIRNPATRLASSKARNFKQIDEQTNIDLFETYKNYDYDYVSSLFLEYEKHKAMQENTTAEFKGKASVSGDEEVDDSDHVWEPIRGVLELNKRKISNEAESYLVRRISRANGRRRQQFAYWKSHKDKLRKTYCRRHCRRDKDAFIGYNSYHAAAYTGSWTKILEKEDVLKFDISEYAPSAWTPSKDTFSFPSPPQVSASDNFFECPYCFTICPISLLSEKAWKAHIIRDLRPYVCTYEHCSNSEQLYDTRDDWIQHEISTHQKIFRCFEHEEESFTTLAAYEEHVQDYHEQNAVFSKFATSTMKNVHRSCPVCSIVLGSIQKLQSHIALHLERFAMFSLPRHTDKSEQSEAESRSDNAQLGLEGSFSVDLETNSGITDKADDTQFVNHQAFTFGDKSLAQSLAYVERIKNRFLDTPEIYTQFLHILENYQRDPYPVKDVYAQMANLFSSAPDILEEFKQYLPGNNSSISKPKGVESPDSLTLEHAMTLLDKVKAHFHDEPEIYTQFLDIMKAFKERQASTEDVASQVTTLLSSAPELLEDFNKFIPKNDSGTSDPKDIERRELPTSIDALDFVDRLKIRFHDRPEIYKQFIETIQNYGRERYPLKEVHAQVATLLSSTPDLLEDFKMFLPRSIDQTGALPGHSEEDTAAGSKYDSQLHESAHTRSSPEQVQSDTHPQLDYPIPRLSAPVSDEDDLENRDEFSTNEEALNALGSTGSGLMSVSMTSVELNRKAKEAAEKERTR